MGFKVNSLFKHIPTPPPKKTKTKSLPPPKLKINIPKTPVGPTQSETKKRKAPIPTALREAVWIHHMGRSFEGKCRVPWCPNTITAFEFQCGHNIPESKGGPTRIDNLVPICSRCNLSMGDRYTISEWGELLHIPKSVPIVEPPKKWWCC